jgi:hypothetical protein
MPWKTDQDESGNWCVYEKDTGKKVKCYGKDKKAADDYVAALYANTSETETAKYELEYGETLVAIAATSKPHLRQRGEEISMVERNGKKMVRVPIAKKGVYRHKLAPDGKLVLDEKRFDRMIQNWENRVTDYNVALDLRHTDQQGALALLDKDDGGELVKEKDWLVSYGYPTDQKAEDLITSKRFRYASAEIHPNYDSNLVHQLSSDDLEIYELEEEKGTDMSNVTIPQEEYDRLKAAEDKLLKLEASQPEPEVQLPESFRLEFEMLKKKSKEADRAIMKSHVALAVSEMKSYRDSKGQAHSEAFINTVSALLLGDNIEQEGSETIKLEGDNGQITPEAVAAYYRQGLIMLAKTTPGQVNMVTKTEPDNIRLELSSSNKNGNLNATDEEVKTFAANAWLNHLPEVN